MVTVREGWMMTREGGSVEDGQREKKRLADRGECLSPPRDSIDISLSSHGPAGE